MNCIHTAVERFREAAIFPQRWPQALDILADSLHSDGATLVLAPTRAHLVTSSASLQPFIQQHFDLPFPDPREHRVNPKLDEGFMTDNAYFSSQEIERNPYYQEFLVPRGFGWNAAAALDGGLVISFKRGRRRGAYAGSDLANLDSALPWLRSASRAASLSWRSNFSGQLSAFNRVGRGAILLDERACVLEVNASVRFGDGLDVSNGCLQAARLEDRQRLSRFLAGALGAGAFGAAEHPSPASTTLSLPRPSGRRPWLLDAIGCVDAVRSLHSRAVALVLVTDMERPSILKEDVLRNVFGLTPVEAKLTCEVIAGRSLQFAAAQLAISEGHARQRLKAIFQKTGTSGQVELVALLSNLR